MDVKQATQKKVEEPEPASDVVVMKAASEKDLESGADLQGGDDDKDDSEDGPW
eukprot:CAMPEP_0197523472 /NCGR_PEP_ID=MMETSP1318-20131121/8391_1 /TAXON_ID=552666 /ORGANISM="Partenskyella glossopodia, Strain RCC365" /LENGTH=52 /DNA_ID=CAMNT_0043076175 /DNA_START=976 /DNA_END=1131 /DNA_ORIENTATION=+